MKSLSRVWLFVTPWTIAYQAPPSLGKDTGVGCHFFPQGSSRPRDRTQVSCIAGRCFTVWATSDALHYYIFPIILKSGSERPMTLFFFCCCCCCFFQYSFGYLGSDEISCHFMLYFSFFAKNSFKYWWKIYGIHHFELYVYVCMYICLLIRKH